PWKAAVTDFLMAYRATPQATTGISPFELLHGRKTHTRLHVLPPPPSNLEKEALHQRVSAKQARMKSYTDSSRGARILVFEEGERVRVRKPTHVPKAHPRYSQPVRVKKK
ncbi:hypothetical protein GOODEAATRI_033246, partial [Goodea atripinnis]